MPLAQSPRYWFAAKRTGYGWGLPRSWQGWVVYATWFIGYIAIFPFLNARDHPIRALLSTMGIVVALAAVCYWKGEPVNWNQRPK